MMHGRALLVLFAMLLVVGCATPHRFEPCSPAALSREELLRYASRIAADESAITDRIDPVVEEVYAVRGRDDLILVVIQHQWCQGIAALYDKRVRQPLTGFYPGQYCSVTEVRDRVEAHGTRIRAEFTTARGNPAGHAELVIKSDNTIEWITRPEW